MTRARQATSTVTFIDEYCQHYQDLFPDGRSFEHFKQLHVGMLSEIKRKTLPAIAKAVGESDPQALHHFLASAPWQAEELRARRLTWLLQALAGKLSRCVSMRRETGRKEKPPITLLINTWGTSASLPMGSCL